MSSSSSHPTQSKARNDFAALYFYCSRISQAIFQADNVLEPAVLREMFKLREKVTKIFSLFANKRSFNIFATSSGGGDQCGRLDLGRRLPPDSGCQETEMHGPGA